MTDDATLLRRAATLLRQGGWPLAHSTADELDALASRAEAPAPSWLDDFQSREMRHKLVKEMPPAIIADGWGDVLNALCDRVAAVSRAPHEEKGT